MCCSSNLHPLFSEECTLIASGGFLSSGIPLQSRGSWPRIAVSKLLLITIMRAVACSSNCLYGTAKCQQYSYKENIRAL